MANTPAHIVYDVPNSPRVELWRTDTAGFKCIVEIEGLDPQRTLTKEELAVGITSLDPPTVVISPREKRRDTHTAVFDAISRAVLASASSTLGDIGAPREIITATFRVLSAVKHAMRLIDEPC